MSHHTPFRERFSEEARLTESQRIRAKYPLRLPVIAEQGRCGSDTLPPMRRDKFLVPADFTMGQFMYIVRKQMKLAPNVALFLFVDDCVPPTSALMSAVHAEKRASDGFLYVTYSGENTFGAFPATSAFTSSTPAGLSRRRRTP